MNRLELLQEIYEQVEHNKYCYSKDNLMNFPKDEYIRQWNQENEKLKILEEMIDEEKNKTKFTKEHILRMYPKTEYYVCNSNGGLLAGTIKLEEAKEYAEKYKKEYLNDSLNNHLGVFVYDKNGKNIYVAKGVQNKFENEETEEFE